MLDCENPEYFKLRAMELIQNKELTQAITLLAAAQLLLEDFKMINKPIVKPAKHISKKEVEALIQKNRKEVIEEREIDSIGATTHENGFIVDKKDGDGPHPFRKEDFFSSSIAIA